MKISRKKLNRLFWPSRKCIKKSLEIVNNRYGVVTANQENRPMPSETLKNGYYWLETTYGKKYIGSIGAVPHDPGGYAVGICGGSNFLQYVCDGCLGLYSQRDGRFEPQYKIISFIEPEKR